MFLQLVSATRRVRSPDCTIINNESANVKGPLMFILSSKGFFFLSSKIFLLHPTFLWIDLFYSRQLRKMRLELKFQFGFIYCLVFLVN
jgi:hypothetical protein